MTRDRDAAGDPREPPVVTCAGEHWRCEGCGLGILTGERVYLYEDEGLAVVTHLECPGRANA